MRYINPRFTYLLTYLLLIGISEYSVPALTNRPADGRRLLGHAARM